MNQDILKKPTKSIFWVIAIIWANIIIIGILWFFAFMFFSTLFPNFYVTTIGRILTILTLWGLPVLAIWLGLKTVLKKSIILPQNIIKISIGVMIPIMILHSGLLIKLIIRHGLPEGLLAMIVGLLAINLWYFSITYFWLKKLT